MAFSIQFEVIIVDRRGPTRSESKCTNHSCYTAANHRGESCFIGDVSLNLWWRLAVCSHKLQVTTSCDKLNSITIRKGHTKTCNYFFSLSKLTCFSANSRSKCFTESLGDCCTEYARLNLGFSWVLPSTSTWKRQDIWAEIISLLSFTQDRKYIKVVVLNVEITVQLSWTG